MRCGETQVNIDSQCKIVLKYTHIGEVVTSEITISYKKK
jgi:hypothetical protein